MIKLLKTLAFIEQKPTIKKTRRFHFTSPPTATFKIATLSQALHEGVFLHPMDVNGSCPSALSPTETEKLKRKRTEVRPGVVSPTQPFGQRFWTMKLKLVGSNFIFFPYQIWWKGNSCKIL